MTVFTILKEKINVKNLKLQTLQGMIVEQLLRRLASFWFPFGSIWVVLVLCWLHFELFTVAFRSLWLAFGSQISERIVWEQLLRRLAPFWSPFGSIWVVLVLFWLHFALITVPFRSLWLAFGSQMSERTFWNTFSKSPWENTRHPDLRTPPSLWVWVWDWDWVLV